MIISARWNLASSKSKKSEENLSGKLGNKLFLSESGFILRTASPSLFRDRRIKMKKSINFNLRNELLKDNSFVLRFMKNHFKNMASPDQMYIGIVVTFKVASAQLFLVLYCLAYTSDNDSSIHVVKNYCG